MPPAGAAAARAVPSLRCCRFSPLSRSRVRRDFDPHRSMIAGFLPRAHVTVDLGSFQSFRNTRAKKKVVNAKSGIAGEGVAKIVPESIDPLVRMKCSQGIRPALRYENAVSRRTSGRNNASSRQRSGL